MQLTANEVVEKSLQLYGMQSLLEAMIENIAKIEYQECRLDSGYLTRLRRDLETALDNYKDRE